MLQSFFLLLACGFFNVHAFLVRSHYSNAGVIPPAIPTAGTTAGGTTSRLLSSSSSDSVDNPKWSTLGSIKIETLDDRLKTLDDVVCVDADKNDDEDGGVLIVSCLSHFGDFNAWELTQQYIAAIDAGRIPKTSQILLVGIGSVKAAQKFSDDLQLDKYSNQLTLVADESGIVTSTLGCYRGWLPMDEDHKARYPQTDINPYLKLFGMIFGFGSPGTIRQVLKGYTGDTIDGRSSNVFGRKWVVDALLQGSNQGRYPRLTEEAFADVESPETASLRPFELATLRLQTGLHIVLNWWKLGPKDGDLFTRMGGTFIFANNKNKEKECIYSYFDKGILVYADIDKVCNVASSSAAAIKAKDEKQQQVTLQSFKEAKQKVENKAKAEKEAAEASKGKEEKEAARLKAEEEARLKAKADEEARLVEAKRIEEEKAKEDARIKAEEEEAARLKAEEDSLAKLQAEAQRLKEEARRLDEEEKAEDEAKEAEEIKQRVYMFQRNRLGAQLEAAKRENIQQIDDTVSTEELEQIDDDAAAAAVAATTETEANERSYDFQRRLLEAQLAISKKSNSEQEEVAVISSGSVYIRKEDEEETDDIEMDNEQTEAMKRVYLLKQQISKGTTQG